MSKSIPGLLFAALLWCCCPFLAHADPVGAYGSRTPTVAFDPVADRGLVVYEHSGRIYGKFIDASGRSVVGSEFLVFPLVASSTLKYRDPAIVFKRPDNRFYIAARQSYPSRYNFPDGPVVFDTADGIAVTALDAAGTRLATRTLYTPGFLRNPLTVDAEARPALAVDDYVDTTCCVAVAWEDPRVPDRILLMRLAPDLGLYDLEAQRIATPAGLVGGISVVHGRARDRFVFAYDGCASPGRACNGYVTSIASLGAPSPLHVMLPKPPNATQAATGPAIAYLPGPARYVLSWQWSTIATPTMPARNGMAFMVATTSTSGALSPGAPNFELGATIVPCAPCLLAAPRARAVIVPVGTTSRAMIVAPSSFAGRSEQFLAGYTVDSATRTVSAGRRFSTDAAYIGRGGAAYSPSGRIVATWQQDVLSGGVDAGVWAAAVLP